MQIDKCKYTKHKQMSKTFDNTYAAQQNALHSHKTQPNTENTPKYRYAASFREH